MNEEQERINKEERCRCGRDKRVLHCPNCGKATIYARPSQAYFISVGDDAKQKIRIMSYRCRGCGTDFDDIHREKCDAQPVGLSMKAIRTHERVESALSGLSRDERLAKIADMLPKKKGIVE